MLRRLRTTDELQLRDLLAIYEEALPASERKPAEILRQMLQDEGYFFLLAEAHDATVGFAIVRALNSGSAALLEYVAVANAYRRRGLGSEIVRGVAQAMEVAAMPLLIETESDSFDCEERALRTRRKQFYRVLGARELQGLRWLMPQVADTLPPPMDLMILDTAEDFIAHDQLQQWLTDIYVEVYQQSTEDPRIEEMMSALPERIPLV